MFEIIVLFMVGCLIAACAYSPQGWFRSFIARFSGAKGLGKTEGTAIAAKNAEPASSFLEQLQQEIEATLFPRPTDSVLRRHYDSLVAVEIQNRLSHFS